MRGALDQLDGTIQFYSERPAASLSTPIRRWGACRADVVDATGWRRAVTVQRKHDLSTVSWHHETFQGHPTEPWDGMIAARGSPFPVAPRGYFAARRKYFCF